MNSRTIRHLLSLVLINAALITIVATICAAQQPVCDVPAAAK